MKKRTALITIGIVSSIIAFMIWDIYEDKKIKAAAEKIYTMSEVLNDADFNVEETAIIIRPIKDETLRINIENEEERNQFIKNITNLKLKKSTGSHQYKEGIFIQLTLNKKYFMYVFEKEKSILIQTNENSGSYDIVNSERFFEELNKFIQLKKPATNS